VLLKICSIYSTWSKCNVIFVGTNTHLFLINRIFSWQRGDYFEMIFCIVHGIYKGVADLWENMWKILMSIFCILSLFFIWDQNPTSRIECLSSWITSPVFINFLLVMSPRIWFVSEKDLLNPGGFALMRRINP
jgi:hypothetical protein